MARAISRSRKSCPVMPIMSPRWRISMATATGIFSASLIPGRRPGWICGCRNRIWCIAQVINAVSIVVRSVDKKVFVICHDLWTTLFWQDGSFQRQTTEGTENHRVNKEDKMNSKKQILIFLFLSIMQPIFLLAADGSWCYFSVSNGDLVVPNCGQQQTASRVMAIDKWQRYHIADLPQRSMYIKPGDLDGDGAIDIVAGGWWWKNPGSLDGVWKQHLVGEPLRNMNEVFDFDRDGDPDVIGTKGVGAETNRQFVWAENDGKGKFTIHSNIDSCESGDFLQGSAMIRLADGYGIALGWHKGGKGTYIIRVPDNPKTEQWKIDLVTETSMKEDISAGDIDRDGDLDMLLGTIWLENRDGQWITHVLGETADLDSDLEPDRNDLADIDGDGRLDAVVSPELGTHLLWYRAPEDPTQPWIRHSVGTIEGQGFSMDTRDFDRDGDPDIVIGEHRGETHNRVVIFQNFDRGRTWSKVVIDKDAKDVIDHHDGTVAVDLDRDGDLDLISVGWYNPKVWVFENLAR
ncbi:hypothetical protein GF406_26790 [candidate division KSB1 bacterium]|nr:hypothetical protein [candidate division KSB1 bacterium]